MFLQCPAHPSSSDLSVGGGPQVFFRGITFIQPKSQVTRAIPTIWDGVYV